jgi:hypothetical protein
MPIDLSKTSTPFDPGALIPSGTTAPMQISVKPGGYGDGGLLTAAETKKGKSAYLHLEFVITGGPHKGRKLWKRSTVEGDDHAAATAITLDLLGSLARSAYNFSATDIGPETEAKLSSFDYATLNKLRVIGKIGIERGGTNETTGEKYPDRNSVVAGVTKDAKEWAQWGAVVQDIDDGLAGAMPSPSTPPVSSPIDPPPWAN